MNKEKSIRLVNYLIPGEVVPELGRSLMIYVHVVNNSMNYIFFSTRKHRLYRQRENLYIGNARKRSFIKYKY